MNSSLFGTDGIRGIANRYPVTPHLALELGLAVAEIFRKGEERPKVVVGRDTRLSGPMLEAAVVAGLLSAGAEAIPLGVIPTPAVALLARELGAVAGIMISASHNPFADNGLKIFQGNGLKCDDALEAQIDARLRAPRTDDTGRPSGADLGRLAPLTDAASRYQAAMLQTCPAGFSLAGMKIAVDAANGSAFETTPAVLRALGAEVILLHATPDGININETCGSTHPEVIEKIVRGTGADLGLAHDGDADRVIVCDEKGSALDGDEFLAIVGLDLLRRGALRKKTMVATVMSNLALDELFTKEGGSIRRCAVGDRAVLEEILTHDLNFGGEQSGHFILRDHAVTGDGLLSALQLLRVVRESGVALSELRQVLKKYPQLLVNLPVRERLGWDQIPNLNEAVAGVEKELSGRGRVLLRYSGTEPKVRLLLEAKEGDSLATLAERILAPIRTAIGA